MSNPLHLQNPKAYQFKQIPAFNNSRADTIASMSRIDDMKFEMRKLILFFHLYINQASINEFGMDT